MASLFADPPDQVSLLDAGAGVGMLTAAFVEDACLRHRRPGEISTTVYELDPLLVGYLHATLAECQETSGTCGVSFLGKVFQEDFIASGVEMLRGGLFPVERLAFNRVILNPPYKKIQTDSKHRQLLSSVGIETTNLYAAFLAIAVELLEPGGELVAITPRSFCNGPYFKPFRKLLFGKMTLRRIHVFESREEAFSADDVLQENVIIHAVKEGSAGRVLVSASHGPAFESMTVHEAEYAQVVSPGDPDLIVHVPTSALDVLVLDRLGAFQYTLADLGIDVSTGRIVDFRTKAYLRLDQDENTAPLIYPAHFRDGFVQWPKPGHRKPNAIVSSSETEHLLLPTGFYVLVRRFSAKEERRRVVAAVFDPTRVPSAVVGFENHLNCYHRDNSGLPQALARGLALFLNSTLVDSYFRQFNGHTQVNATDLRMLRYPSRDILSTLGAYVLDKFPSQAEIDELLEREIRCMTDIQSPDPVVAKQKIDEALTILEAFGMPKGQLNERSALTLLALLELQPDTTWSAARDPMMGITPIMDLCREHYGRTYAPNTRETFRRQTMHQLVEGGFAIPNPDDPGRPVNSPKYCYQIEPTALSVLKTFGSSKWSDNLKNYLRSIETLKQRYARARALKMVPVTLAEGKEVYLTPGVHSQLVKAIIDEFAPRFVPGGHVIYVGDTGEKWKYFDEDALYALGAGVDVHGKMPDVVVHDVDRDWLVLIEVVTSHGPVNPKRRGELAHLFSDIQAGLVYVTAFLTRGDMAKYVSDISWETEVWVKEDGTHLIHFDGKRFLGPYDS